jgi:hypothetical protein
MREVSPSLVQMWLRWVCTVGGDTKSRVANGYGPGAARNSRCARGTAPDVRRLHDQ